MIPRRYKSDMTVSEKAEGSPYFFFFHVPQRIPGRALGSRISAYSEHGPIVSLEVEFRVYVREKFGSFPVHAGLALSEI